jgi:hypothetical protein
MPKNKIQWGDPEYYVKRIGFNGHTVAKFTTHFAPDAVYTVRYETCTCPVGFNCKHVQLVKIWVELGEPPMCIWRPQADGTWISQVMAISGGLLHDTDAPVSH